MIKCQKNFSLIWVCLFLAAIIHDNAMVIWVMIIQITLIYFWRYMMSTNAFPKTSVQPSGSEMRSEIQQKWSKFNPEEIAALKTTDDLVAQVQSKYQLDRSKAQGEVDAFAKGRQL